MTMVLFGLIILTFIFWGVYDFSGGGSQSVLTRVNGDNISMTEFNAVYRGQLRRYSQFFGGQVNESIESMIRQQVARNLVSSHLLAQRAREAGLVVGREQLIEQLENIEAFHDPSTQRFSPRRYQEAIEAALYRTPRVFEESLSRDLLNQQFQSLFMESVLISEQEIKDREWVESFRFDLRSALLSPTKMADAGLLDLNETKLRAYYEENSAQFMSEEKRSLEVARFNTFDFRNRVEIPEEEIQTFFEAEVKNSNAEEWNQKRARAAHILISDKSPAGKRKAQSLIQRLRQSSSDRQSLESAFRQIALTESEDFRSAFRGGDLGYFDEDAMVEPFSKVVFDQATPLAQVAGPVQSDFGWHVILPLDRTGESRALKNREAEIRYRLQEQRLVEQLSLLREELQKEVVGQIQSFEDFFKGRGFEVTSVEALERTAPSEALPTVLIQRAFNAPLNEWLSPEEFEDNLFVFRVTEIQSPQVLDFENAEADVKKEVARREAEEKAQALAEEIRNGKRSFDSLSAFRANLLTENSFAPFTSQELPGFGPAETLLRAVQALSEEAPLSSVLSHKGSYVIFEAKNFRQQPSEAEEAKAKRQALESQKQRALFESYTEDLLESAKIPDEDRQALGLVNAAERF